MAHRPHESHDCSPASAQVLLALGLKVFAVIAQMICGFYTGSHSIRADAFHLIMDIGSNVVVLIAIKVGRAQKSDQMKEKVQAVCGGLIALIICLASYFIVSHAHGRLGHEDEIISGPMIVVAILGLLINLFNLYILGAHVHLFAVHAVRVHEFWDFISSVAVIVCGIGMYATSNYQLDTYATYGIGLLMLVRGIKLFDQAIYHYRKIKPEDA